MADIPKPTGLDWVKLHKDMDHIGIVETSWDKILRKCKQNPLVPFGATVTIGALTYGLYNFYKGRGKMQQKMMRLRVAAQLFTIVAAIGGIMITLPKEKRNWKGLVESGDKPS